MARLRIWGRSSAPEETGTTQTKADGSLVSAAGGLFGFLMLARLIGLVKELAIAARFGLSDELDVFLVATGIPMLVVSVVGQGYGMAIVPVLLQVESNSGHEAARRLLQSAVFLAAVLFLAIAASMAVMSPWLVPWIAVGFGPGKTNSTILLFLLLLPTTIFLGLSSIWSAFLNARGACAVPVLIGTISPMLIIVSMATLPMEFANKSLVIGTIGGAVVECALMAWAIRQHRFRSMPRFFGLTSELKQIWRQFLPSACGSTIHGCSAIIDQSLASSLGGGALAALNYGSKLVGVAAGLLGQSFATILFPRFVKDSVQKDWISLGQRLRQAILISLFVALGVTGFFTVFSRPLVVLFFQRGALTADECSRIAIIQTLASAQLPFYFVGVVLLRFSAALRQTRWVLIACTINLACSLIFSLLMTPYLAEAGIALSKTFVYASSALVMGIGASQALRQKRQHDLTLQPETTEAAESQAA